jgi:hypothetical protein
VVADPFLDLALFSPPLASSTKTGSILSLLTSLPHQNCQLRAKGDKRYGDELGVSYPLIGVQWKSFMVQVHLSLSILLLRLNQASSNTWLVSKDQVVAHLPLNMCITCKWTCEVRGVLVQLEHCWGLVLKCYELRTRQHRKY